MTPTPAQIEAAAKALYVEPIDALDLEMAKRALTAAAEVGDDQERMWKQAVTDERAITIQRCAQVAENSYQWFGKDIAAAIRALKDKHD